MELAILIIISRKFWFLKCFNKAIVPMKSPKQSNAINLSDSRSNLALYGIKEFSGGIIITEF